MSHMVDDIDAAMQTARNAGATLLHGPDRIDGEFGSRITAFFRSPGGLVFCLFQVIEHKAVPPAQIFAPLVNKHANTSARSSGLRYPKPCRNIHSKPLA